MWRRILACAVLAAVALALSSHWWSAYGGKTTLGYRLERARGGEEIAGVATELLLLTDYVADDLLRRMGRRDPRVAFDPVHRAFVVFDLETGDLWCRVAGSVAAQPGFDPSAPAMMPGIGLRAVQAFTWPVPLDPANVAEVRAVPVSPVECWFVLRSSAAGAAWVGCRISYDQTGAVVAGAPTRLDEATTDMLRNSGAWPRHWQNR